ncbi:MAG: hypothetical protein B7733_06780 [Myxococcales bacterium FL481]|nr:MAG: hypothetical protein B7733_06780 [Myxococcales bacterium FL481]
MNETTRIYLDPPPWVHSVLVVAIISTGAAALGIYFGSVVTWPVVAIAGLALVAWWRTTYRTGGNRRTFPRYNVTVAASLAATVFLCHGGFVDQLTQLFWRAADPPAAFHEAGFLAVFAFGATALFLWGGLGVYLLHPLGAYMAWLVFLWSIGLSLCCLMLAVAWRSPGLGSFFFVAMLGLGVHGIRSTISLHREEVARHVRVGAVS